MISNCTGKYYKCQFLRGKSQFSRINPQRKIFPQIFGLFFQKFFKVEKFQIFSTFNQNQSDFHSRDGIFLGKLHSIWQCKTERSKVPLQNPWFKRTRSAFKLKTGVTQTFTFWMETLLSMTVAGIFHFSLKESNEDCGAWYPLIAKKYDRKLWEISWRWKYLWKTLDCFQKEKEAKTFWMETLL